MRFSRAVIRITLLGESHATFVAWSPPWDCEGVTWAPWTSVRALPDIINTLPLPVSMALIAPSCDWTKNNKDNDARNNDERLEQRNWEPRGGAGAGPGRGRDARQDDFGSLAPILDTHVTRCESAWAGTGHMTDENLWHSLTPTLGEQLKINTIIIFHISDHWWWAGKNSPQLPLQRPSILDNAICCYRCWSGILTGG